MTLLARKMAGGMHRSCQCIDIWKIRIRDSDGLRFLGEAG